MTNYEKVKSIKGIPLEEVPVNILLEYIANISGLVFAHSAPNLVRDPYYSRPQGIEETERTVSRLEGMKSDLKNEMVRRIMENV